MLGDTIKTLEGRGITVLLSGVKDLHESVFEALGIYDNLADRRHVFPTTPAAIDHARIHARRAAEHGDVGGDVGSGLAIGHGGSAVGVGARGLCAGRHCGQKLRKPVMIRALVKSMKNAPTSGATRNITPHH